MEVADSKDKNKTAERRPFSAMIDYAPIEHILFGSSCNIGDVFINSDNLKKYPQIANNIGLLLTPLGLIDKKTTIKEVSLNRKRKKQLPMSPVWLVGPTNCVFVYECKPLNPNGEIPNSFTFKVINGDRPWDSSNSDDIAMLEEITLSDDPLAKIKDNPPLFSLFKDNIRGTVTLEYLPIKMLAKAMPA